MRPGIALLALALLCQPALAQDRGTRIAMAVALLDVAADHCAGTLRVDAGVKKKLMAHFHEYDIAGLASLLSQPLNAFYEDFAYEAKREREAFCRRAPSEAAATGYPVIVAGPR
ncbi:MAG: hypothetical protein ACKOED_13015 [Aestuariivirga sp.]|uniref:hypothetical protein n=1 Tax=Aestuariivirga sp. TaxID=2650926 RepID=UPI0038CFBB18